MATKREMMKEIETLTNEAYARINSSWKIGETLSAPEIASFTNGFLNKRGITSLLNCTCSNSVLCGGAYIAFKREYRTETITYANVNNPYDTITITKRFLVYTRLR